MRITPNNITELLENEVFVFGSNRLGNHLGGAARIANDKFGAIMGQSEGFQGQSYGINTMDGLEIMVEQIKRFVKYAKQFEKVPIKFLVTEIGCGIAGYEIDEIAPLFIEASKLENVYLPLNFWNYIHQLQNY
jgi:hypothetical protein